MNRWGRWGLAGALQRVGQAVGQQRDHRCNILCGNPGGRDTHIVLPVRKHERRMFRMPCDAQEHVVASEILNEDPARKVALRHATSVHA